MINELIGIRLIWIGHLNDLTTKPPSYISLPRRLPFVIDPFFKCSVANLICRFSIGRFPILRTRVARLRRRAPPLLVRAPHPTQTKSKEASHSRRKSFMLRVNFHTQPSSTHFTISAHLDYIGINQQSSAFHQIQTHCSL